MKRTALIVFILTVVPVTVHAQVYSDKHDELVSSVDRAAADANKIYANVAVAGAQEEALSQEQHYDYLTQPLHKANERHFNEADSMTRNTIIENEVK